MAWVVNKTTLQYKTSVNTPEYSSNDWLISPDMTAVESVSPKYWKIVDNSLVEMNQAEKDIVDAEISNRKNLTIAGIMTLTKAGNCRNTWLRGNEGQATNRIPYIIPQAIKISAITYANDSDGSDADVEIYLNDALVFTWELRDKRYAYKTNDLYNLTMNQGDRLSVFVRDKGTNPKHVTLNIHYTVIGNTVSEGGASQL